VNTPVATGDPVVLSVDRRLFTTDASSNNERTFYTIFATDEVQLIGRALAVVRSRCWFVLDAFTSGRQNEGAIRDRRVGLVLAAFSLKKGLDVVATHIIRRNVSSARMEEPTMIDFSLQHQTALITGASRGIGEAIAECLAAQGAHCILVSRKIDALTTVAEKIRHNGGQADAIACHMGQLDQIEQLFDQVAERYGKLNILVNNAAANPFFGEMIQVTEAAWEKTIDVNIKGPFFMIQKAVPLMEKAGGGAIVNVSSVAAIQAPVFQGVYAMTKTAMVSMTKAYAKELAGRNIRVNAILPGLTETKFAGALFENQDIYQTAIRMIPMGRHAAPNEMAGAVLYLVSDAATFTTGATIVCDGGMTS
jgi:NAD(P)-dependent dehydrogenase (short-subunit alcohol dehydrogenase family)